MTRRRRRSAWGAGRRGALPIRPAAAGRRRSSADVVGLRTLVPSGQPARPGGIPSPGPPWVATLALIRPDSRFFLKSETPPAVGRGRWAAVGGTGAGPRRRTGSPATDGG